MTTGVLSESSGGIPNIERLMDSLSSVGYMHPLVGGFLVEIFKRNGLRDLSPSDVPILCGEIIRVIDGEYQLRGVFDRANDEFAEVNHLLWCGFNLQAVLRNNALIFDGIVTALAVLDPEAFAGATVYASATIH